MEIQNKLEWYQEQTKRTCPDLGSEAVNLAHMVLGMFSEYAEYLEAIAKNDLVNCGEECGDVWWYLSNYCNIRNYSLNSLYQQKSPNLNMDYASYADIKNEKYYLYCISILQDMVKKNLAYGKEIYTIVEEEILKNIIFHLDNFSINHGNNLENILENNINKLRIRFPEKFTQENALNRNLEAERIELEK